VNYSRLSFFFLLKVPEIKLQEELITTFHIKEIAYHNFLMKSFLPHVQPVHCCGKSIKFNITGKIESFTGILISFG